MPEAHWGEIKDPVHGYIYITEVEREIIDTFPMQRLRRIKQLSGAHLTYPGAEHSRFSHSLGDIRAKISAVIGQPMIDTASVLSGLNMPKKVGRVKEMWQRDLRGEPPFPKLSYFLPSKFQPMRDYLCLTPFPEVDRYSFSLVDFQLLYHDGFSHR
jgi:hypothetical protein